VLLRAADWGAWPHEISDDGGWVTENSAQGKGGGCFGLVFHPGRTRGMVRCSSGREVMLACVQMHLKGYGRNKQCRTDRERRVQ
jgi:hypothetical protein